MRKIKLFLMATSIVLLLGFLSYRSGVLRNTNAEQVLDYVLLSLQPHLMKEEPLSYDWHLHILKRTFIAYKEIRNYKKYRMIGRFFDMKAGTRTLGRSPFNVYVDSPNVPLIDDLLGKDNVSEVMVFLKKSPADRSYAVSQLMEYFIRRGEKEKAYDLIEKSGDKSGQYCRAVKVLSEIDEVDEALAIIDRGEFDVCQIDVLVDIALSLHRNGRGLDQSQKEILERVLRSAKNQ